MAAVTAFILTGATMIVALVAVFLLSGGWQAAAAGLAILAGFAFIAVVAALEAEGDGLAPRH
jgi:hypothetical protein